MRRSLDHSKCHRYVLLFLRNKWNPFEHPDPCYMLLQINCGQDMASFKGSKRNGRGGGPLQSRPDSSRAFTTTHPVLLCQRSLRWTSCPLLVTFQRARNHMKKIKRHQNFTQTCFSFLNCQENANPKKQSGQIDLSYPKMEGGVLSNIPAYYRENILICLCTHKQTNSKCCL